MTKLFSSFRLTFGRTRRCLQELALGFHAMNHVLDPVLEHFTHRRRPIRRWCLRSLFKGPPLSSLRILDSQTHFKPTETFQYTHFSSCHPFNTKKSFIKGEALHLLRTNWIKENFYKHKRDFEQRLCNGGYPVALVHKILTEVQFSDRTEALHNKTIKECERNFTVCYHLKPSYTKSQKDSHEKPAHHSTATYTCTYL